MTNDQTRERARIEYEYGIKQARSAHGQVRHWINYCIEQLIIIGFPKEHISAKLTYDLPEISGSYIREICASLNCTNTAFANRGEGGEESEFDEDKAHDNDGGDMAARIPDRTPSNIETRYFEHGKPVLDNNKVFRQHDPVTTPAPAARANTLSEAWKSAAKACERMADITEKYPPKAGVEESALANAVLDFFEVVAPTPDLKWSKCLPDWYKIELDNVIHGKHAAGAINATITPDGQRRKITREQVGERYDVIFEHALAFVNSIPLLKMSIQYYRQQYVDPAVAIRKIELAPKLSEQA